MKTSPLDFYDPTTGSEVQCQYGETAITIRRVFTPEDKRWQGGASRLIREICRTADRIQMQLVLYAVPDPDSPYSVNRLIDFYHKFGFKLEPGLEPDEPQCMTRKPRANGAK